MCHGADVIIVGAGKLRRTSSRVSRRAHSQSFSSGPRRRSVQEHVQYLAQRIEKTPNIEVLCNNDGEADVGRSLPAVGRDRQRQYPRGADIGNPCAFQLYRGHAEDRLAAEGNRDGLLGVYSHRSGFDAVASDFAPSAVFAGDQPAQRVRCGRCSIGFDKARCLGCRRGGDGGAVCGRVSEGNVGLHEDSRTAIR